MIYLKYVGLVLGLVMLFFPSIQDKEAKPLSKVISFFIALLIVIIAGFEIHREDRKLNPNDMKFIVTYNCRGVDNEKDIYKHCPKSFYATLQNPKGALKYELNRIDNIERQPARGFKTKYSVLYESKYLKPENDYFDEKIIESESDIKGEIIILKFSNSRSIEEQIELEKNFEKGKINDWFDCVLYLKGRKYKGEIDSTYLKNYYNSTHYGFAFVIDK